MSKIVTNYNAETGISTATINSRYGQITASVKCAEEDKDIENKWDGCRFALHKAEIELHKVKCRSLYQRYIGANTVLNNLKQKYSEFDPFIIDAEKQVGIILRDYEQERKLTKTIEDNYPIYVKQSLFLRRAVREKN